MILSRSENPDGIRVFNRRMTLTDTVDSRQRKGRHPHRLGSVMDNCALPDQTQTLPGTPLKVSDSRPS